MIIIKNKTELKEYLNKDKDLIVDEDVRIEYQVERGELRDVKCRNLYLENDNEFFDFNGRDFDGRDFDGWDFNGRDFDGWDFNGRDFNGLNFNGKDFNGRNFKGWNFIGNSFIGNDIDYYASFIAYEKISCTSIKGRRKNSIHKCLDSEIEIRKDRM